MLHSPTPREQTLGQATHFKVVVPFFNGMKYLKKCLESIESQNYADYDVVVIDDASTEFGIKRYALDFCNRHG